MAAAAAEPAAYEGPVLSVINKRLRALRKKLNRITQMEESLSQGKTLNKEQEETFRSKPSVLVAIDELEKLRAPLQQALAQEIELTLKQKQEEKAEEVAPQTKGDKEDLADVLKLLYFASVFDVKTLFEAHDNMLTRTHERNCCLTYDYVTDEDADFEPLKEGDLDVIAKLGGLLLSRPVGSSLSHKNALETCVERARLWAESSGEEIDPGSGVTYAALREKLNKIMASEYFTTTPEIKAPVEVAAAGGNYASFQVISPVGETLQAEVPNYPQQEEDQSPPDSLENTHAEKTGSIEDPHLGEQETENSPELQAQTETALPDTETDQNPRESDFIENHTNRRSYQQNYRGGRGGGRRGYYNGGRGGRGMGRANYRNDRGGQSYDQPGGYYPRNYSYRGRGGRGMNGNYNNYDNHGQHPGNAQVASS